MTAPLRFRWRAAVLDPECGLPWRGRYLALVLAEYARNDSDVLDPAPSALTLAAAMAVSLAGVHRGRRELEQGGWLADHPAVGPAQPDAARLARRTPVSHAGV